MSGSKSALEVGWEARGPLLSTEPLWAEASPCFSLAEGENPASPHIPLGSARSPFDSDVLLFMAWICTAATILLRPKAAAGHSRLHQGMREKPGAQGPGALSAARSFFSACL